MPLQNSIRFLSFSIRTSTDCLLLCILSITCVFVCYNICHFLTFVFTGYYLEVKMTDKESLNVDTVVDSIASPRQRGKGLHKESSLIRLHSLPILQVGGVSCLCRIAYASYTLAHAHLTIALCCASRASRAVLKAFAFATFLRLYSQVITWKSR